jgi:hypothetical protein
MVLPSLKNKLKFRVKKQERRILANPSYWGLNNKKKVVSTESKEEH